MINEGEEATKRAPRIRPVYGNGRSVEGGEESGEEGLVPGFGGLRAQEANGKNMATIDIYDLSGGRGGA